MLNKVIFVGRLTRDPELSFTQNGKAVARFSIAVDRTFKREGQPDVDFFRVSVWGKSGENCANFLGKGSMVAVDGRIEINKYNDKEGNERTSVDVTANDVRFLSHPKDKDDSQERKEDVKDDQTRQEPKSEGLPF